MNLEYDLFDKIFPNRDWFELRRSSMTKVIYDTDSLIINDIYYANPVVIMEKYKDNIEITVLSNEKQNIFHKIYQLRFNELF